MRRISHFGIENCAVRCTKQSVPCPLWVKSGLMHRNKDTQGCQKTRARRALARAAPIMTCLPRRPTGPRRSKRRLRDNREQSWRRPRRHMTILYRECHSTLTARPRGPLRAAYGAAHGPSGWNWLADRSIYEQPCGHRYRTDLSEMPSRRSRPVRAQVPRNRPAHGQLTLHWATGHGLRFRHRAVRPV
jgi:hypothetical protein